MSMKIHGILCRRRGILVRTFYYLLFLVGLVGIFDTSGIYIQLREKDYATEFSWPLEAPDFVDIIKHFR